MVGRSVNAIYQREASPPGEVLLRVNRSLPRAVAQYFVRTAGRVKSSGSAGLMGAGRTELCRVLFGLDPAESGTVEIAGRAVTPKNPRQAVASGVALIPEDRQINGLALKLPIAFNITMPDLGRVSRYGVVNHSAENRSLKTTASACGSSANRRGNSPDG